MQPIDKERADCEHAVSRAKVAINHRHFAEAMRQMRLAASLNANRADIQWLQDEFYVERQKAAQRASLTYAIGPLVAGAIYFLLGLTSPRSVSIPVWIFLSFILVPICAGYAVGRQYSPERPPKVRFWAGMWSVGSAMFCYTAISLALIRGRIGQPDPSGQVFLVGLFASTLYAVIAGSIAGISAKLSYKWDPYEQGTNS